LQPQNGYRLIFSLSSRVYYTRITPAVTLIYLSLPYVRNLLLRYNQSHPLQSFSCSCNSLLLHLTLGLPSSIYPIVALLLIAGYYGTSQHYAAPVYCHHHCHLAISRPPGVTESVTSRPWVLRNPASLYCLSQLIISLWSRWRTSLIAGYYTTLSALCSSHILYSLLVLWYRDH
jgi:hypothetical protein